MLKCTGYYSEPQEEVDYEYYEKLGLPIPELKKPEIIETTCYINTGYLVPDTCCGEKVRRRKPSPKVKTAHCKPT